MALIERTKGKSPYAKHAKKEFRYSDEYADWSVAVEKHGHDSEEASTADYKFRRKFGVPTVTVAEDGSAKYARY
jgi:hypothetical protein